MRVRSESSSSLLTCPAASLTERRVFQFDAALGDLLDQVFRDLQEHLAALERGVQRVHGLRHLGFGGRHLRVQPSADAAALLGRRGDAGDAALDVSQGLVERAGLAVAGLGACTVLARDLARQRGNAFVEFGHRAHDVLAGGLDLGGQVFHRIGHHAETAPGVAGALGFDRGVERHQARLQCDLGDGAGRLRHLLQAGDDAGHLVGHLFDGRTRPRHGIEAAAGHSADVVLRAGDLVHLRGQHGERLHLARRRLVRVFDLAADFGSFLAHRRGLLADGPYRGLQIRCRGRRSDAKAVGFGRRWRRAVALEHLEHALFPV